MYWVLALGSTMPSKVMIADVIAVREVKGYIVIPYGSCDFNLRFPHELSCTVLDKDARKLMKEVYDVYVGFRQRS